MKPNEKLCSENRGILIYFMLVFMAIQVTGLPTTQDMDMAW